MKAKILKLVEETARYPQRLSGEARLVEDLGMNSLQFMLLISMLEDEFDITIPSHKTEAIKRVADLMKLFEPEEPRKAS
ncbi:acyl carrier protein [Microbulbifer rhizosphaerae]|uniref:Acyl carrier protein AcpXL n=1 Tax=Microbulbifer rhizosphaerae TaxID=1562603 RepID=A0A7W4Z9U4_9GAMM|nr:acyl carrier protein [Microbulbifer rhizosphaerae]MBB3061931.1 acyl carrier protein [Microbulbifer rhizosphaerae]